MGFFNSTEMEIKFEKSAGCVAYHQEVTDSLVKLYTNIDDLLIEVTRNDNEFIVKREKHEGFILFSISKIDLKNDILTLDWVTVTKSERN